MSEGPLIVIVDDDRSIRNATQLLLKASGFSTAAFADADSFLRSSSVASAACLVADMRMPGMSGLELHLQLVASGQSIPIIIITAHPEQLTQARVREAGITCYLVKPFAPDELLECIGEALAKPQTRRPIPKS